MAITFVGQATGTNTATMPAHQAGDLILVWAYRDGVATAPTLVAGYTSLQAPAGSTQAARLAYKKAASSAETVGTWTNATSVCVQVYRGVHADVQIGQSASQTAAVATVTWPAIQAMKAPDGNSWVAGFMGHRSVNGTYTTAPTGMTARSYVLDATDVAAGFDTNGGSYGWASTTTSPGGTAAGWSTATVEIIAADNTGSSYGASVTTNWFGPLNAIGTNWTNPMNSLSYDSAYATTFVPGAMGAEYGLFNYNFVGLYAAIPNGAKIVGIEVQCKGYAENPGGGYTYTKLVSPGLFTPLASTATRTAPFTTSDSTWSVGGTADDWGGADTNNNSVKDRDWRRLDFGPDMTTYIGIAADMVGRMGYVDGVKMRVTYQPLSAPTVITVDTVSYTSTTNAVNLNEKIPVTQATYAQTTNAVKVSERIPVSAVSYTQSQTANVKLNERIPVTLVTYSSSPASTVKVSEAIPVTAVAYVQTLTTGVKLNEKIPVGTISYAQTTFDVLVKNGTVIPVTTVSYTSTTNPVKLNEKIPVGTVAYTQTTNPVGVKANMWVTVDPVSYSMTMNPVKVSESIPVLGVSYVQTTFPAYANTTIWVDPISYESQLTAVGYVSSTGNSSLPSEHQPGDLIVGHIFRDGSTVAPSVPAGWTVLQTRTATNASAILAYKVAQSSSEVFSGWVNATGIIIHVYRNWGGIGAFAMNSGVSTTVNMPALSLSGADSWVAAFAGTIVASANSLNTAPTGTTRRATAIDTTDSAAGYDTNGPVGTWTGRNITTASGSWITSSIEILPRDYFIKVSESIPVGQVDYLMSTFDVDVRNKIDTIIAVDPVAYLSTTGVFKISETIHPETVNYTSTVGEVYLHELIKVTGVNYTSTTGTATLPTRVKIDPVAYTSTTGVFKINEAIKVAVVEYLETRNDVLIDVSINGELKWLATMSWLEWVKVNGSVRMVRKVRSQLLNIKVTKEGVLVKPASSTAKLQARPARVGKLQSASSSGKLLERANGTE